ncbi:SDR family mycofactocin-dependent oxidoreductase [Geodermatophilus sp. TF02-6]|uniref:mycofactocin-coupled SDR family oxidoreductase n=1 Tax=Geodermatophilus sp. TF02-6 TaxID=2250575 RepID=UPI000DE96556|nr:mycofactocin-coupled SDR family oxidoreductase [Geodermatophilus sp. TF02-6]RBY83660.1 SDR family mycofactocin-dependent oxidoreductase [Geodermatophilus sp. TF02-6]
MRPRFEGKVAFVTGAARGQGRNHAVRLAEEGADVVALDICSGIGSIGYDLATPADLAETVRQVERLDRRVVAGEVDVRDGAAVRGLLDEAVAELGRLDVVVGNAGIAGSAPLVELSDEAWADMIGTNLTGVFQTCRAAVPHLGRGGSIVLTSSIAGVKGLPNNAHYTAAKHGVMGLMRALANELAPSGIRVNCVNPTNVDTRMLFNDAIYRLFRPDLEHPGRGDVEDIMRGMHPMDTGWVEPDDVSNAVLFLASDEARYITGAALPVDAGALNK